MRGSGIAMRFKSRGFDASWLILDYVAICDSRNELLDFADFIPLWIVANEIAEERTDSRERLLVTDMQAD
jgi:hypothetical protein